MPMGPMGGFGGGAGVTVSTSFFPRSQNVRVSKPDVVPIDLQGTYDTPTGFIFGFLDQFKGECGSLGVPGGFGTHQHPRVPSGGLRGGFHGPHEGEMRLVSPSIEMFGEELNVSHGWSALKTN